MISEMTEHKERLSEVITIYEGQYYGLENCNPGRRFPRRFHRFRPSLLLVPLLFFFFSRTAISERQMSEHDIVKSEFRCIRASMQ